MFYALSRLVTMLLFRALWRPVIEGREHIPATGPLIVASNHLSFIDSIVIPLAVPRRVAFLAKAEYFEGRSLASLPRRGVFPPPRAGAGKRGPQPHPPAPPRPPGAPLCPRRGVGGF